MSKWEMVRLGDYIEQIRGISYKPKDLSNTPLQTHIAIIRANNIQDEGLNFNDLIYIDRKKINNQQYLRKGDIVICASSGSKNLVGKAAQVQNDANISFGAFCKVVRTEKIYNPYLGNFFKSKYYRRTISDLSAGININNLRSEHINDLIIPLPPLETQEQIAKVLDTASELISLQKQQLEELDNLIKSAFYDMFGDPVTNEKGWEKRRLGDECKIITGNTPSRKEKENYGSFIEWIKSDNINIEGMYLSKATECLSEQGFSKCRFVDKPSVLMTCIAGSINCIGNVGIANRRVAFNQQINAVVPGKNNVYYMYVMFMLTKKYIQSTINMSLKGILSKGKLSELEFIFPPLPLQIKFAQIVSKIEEQKTLVQKAIDESQYLFDSLMSKYFD